MYAPQAQLFARQFPAEIRYSGISISVQLAGVVGGGLAPLIATKLLSVGAGNPYLIMLYIASMAVVAIIATSFMPRDHRQQALATENNKQGGKLQAKMTE
ncbi:major facilitator superfamily (MFS) metabolite/H+ symporter domain protein [Acinetobacter baumannii 146457]|nr:major facilitator superfamily (MFS) metabolite/H+ symporter domain protein [Acinetobacter baumannii 146457]